MNQAEFRKLLMNEGFEGPFEYVKGPDFVDEEHVHDFDVLAMVVEGTLTIEKPSGDQTCHVGETVSFPAGEPHVEKPGPDGVKALVGRRTPEK
jgi:uncharacterized cupin superfamily protein